MATEQSVQTVELDSVDLMDTSWFADGPPHELFTRIREEAPVKWQDLPNGPVPGFWSVTRYEDVTAVSKDWENFSSWEEGIFLQRDQVAPLDLNRNLLLYMDPPQHTKYRKLLQTAFVPNTIKKMADANRARVTRVIDNVIERGECDFVQDIAIPIPLGILMSMMGLPEEDLPQLLEWSEEIEHATLGFEPNGALETFGKLAGYLNEAIQRQLQEGNQDSLVMRLHTAEMEGEKLKDEEIFVFFALLVFAGNDTTRNTTAAGVYHLLEDRDQWQKLVDDPSLIPDAVEEILRYTSVVNWFKRTAKNDVEIGGQQIKAGDAVVLWYTSSSRDAPACPHAEQLDVTRGKPDHTAFGGGGRHFCLGSGLARQELTIIFEEVTRRMPDLERTGPVKRAESTWANALKSMPVKFTPGQREG